MKKLTLLTLFLAPLLLAQPGPVSIRPDCFQFFTFTVTGNSNVFDNRSAGCPYFAISYSSNGFTVESLVVQTAPDAGGTPGAWSTYTAATGVNPNTAITQASSTFSGYFPWLRVQLTSVTGTGSITGILYGWRTPPTTIAGGGTVTIAPNSSVNVTQLGGVTVTACNQQAPFNISASGNTQIIAASGSLTPLICYLVYSTTATEDIKLTTGTGLNCVVGTADLTGLLKSVQSQDSNFSPFSPMTGVASGAICMNTSAATALGGWVKYGYQ